MTPQGRILRSALHSAVSLTPLITIAASRALYGPEGQAVVQFNDALRHARQLVTELELQAIKLGAVARESSDA